MSADEKLNARLAGIDDEIAKYDIENERKVILAYLEKKSKLNNIVLKNANTRNIIFLGRSRVGKTTALKSLKDPYTFTEAFQSFWAGTRNPELHSFTVEYSDPIGSADSEKKESEKINYNINIIDTPGLFERLKETSEIRENELIMDVILKCLQFEITKIHCLFFVCSFESGINAEDVASVLKLNKLFAGGNKAFNLLVTHCEGKSPEIRKEMEKQIREIPELKEFFASADVKIFFLGALNYDFYDRGDVTGIARLLTNVLIMRTTIYKHIFSCSDNCHITKLEFFEKQQQNISALAEKVSNLTEQLEKYKGTEKEREELERLLREKNREFQGMCDMVAGVTGQKTELLYGEIMKRANKVLPDEKRSLNNSGSNVFDT